MSYIKIGKVESVIQQELNKKVKDEISKYESNMKNEIGNLILQEAKKLRPVEINLPNGESTQIEGNVHYKFQETLFLANQEKQVYIQGPAGSGKTMLAKQVAEGLNLSFGAMSVTAGMSEAHLTGRMVFDGSFVGTRFLDIYENGGVFLLDEVDAADPNTLLIINTAIANGELPVPNRKDNPVAKRHKDFILLAAANTWGNGSSDYSGREMQDEAFLDRFSLSKVHIDYDSDLEKRISSGYNGIYTMLTNMRQVINDKGLKRVISTRCIESAVNQFASGCTFKEIFDRLTIDWETTEISKVVSCLSNVQNKFSDNSSDVVAAEQNSEESSEKDYDYQEEVDVFDENEEVSVLDDYEEDHNSEDEPF